MTGARHTDVESVITIPFLIVPGQTDKFIANFYLNWLSQDIHIDRLNLSTDVAPGTGTSLVVTVTDGVGTMTATLSTASQTNTTTGNFDLDVSVRSLAVSYTAHAESNAVCGFLVITYHTIQISSV